MRRKIEALAICLIIIVSSIVFTACSKVSKYYGSWTSITCEYQGKECSTNEMVGSFSMEINEDGTAKYTCYGIDAEGKWRMNDDGTMTVVSDNFEDITFEIRDKQLVLDMNDLVVIYDKQEE